MAFRRVVVTGMGIVNPIGKNAAEFWDSLVHGKSGVRTIQAFDVGPLPARIAGEIPDFDAKHYIDKKDRKSIKVMARAIQLAVAAAQLALDDGKVDKSQLDPTRFGVEFGAGLMPSEPAELGPASRISTTNGTTPPADLRQWGAEGLPVISPLWLLKYLPNMPACHVSILHNAQGPSNSLIAGDVGSLLALGEAYRIIGRDQADFFLAGGADTKLQPLSLARQCLFAELSRRNDSPEQACRPFDKKRDGAVLGEGGGVFVVEELQHARRRGARIYAEIVGFASAFDRGRTGKRLAQAMQSALRQAGITPDDVDHVNAHGLGSVPLDPWEARAIHDVFGKRPIPVFAAKSYFGNLYAASGTSELAASVLALVHGQVPRTLNYEEPDPACPVAVTREIQPVTRPYFLKLGLTDLGQCAVVVCRKWE